MNEFWVKVQAQLEDSKFKKQMEQLSKKKYKVDVDVSNSGSKKATRDLEQLAYEATHTQTVFGKLKKSVGETFSGNKMAVTAYLATLKAIKSAASDAKTAIVDMDKAVTDLSVAQGQGRDTATNYLKQLNLQAQSIGATTKEVAQSADSWLRQGKSVKETGDLVYDSMILSKLGQIESAKASEYLTSALNGYKKSASEAIDIVDKLTAVDMESASDAGGLAESMSRTASAASMAGVSIDKLIGMISTVKEVTQASDESVGNMFKSVFSRMNQIKAGKFVDEETGESLNDTEKVLNKIGISMRDTNGQFLSSEKILDEVGSKWKSFDGVTQRAVATAMAGTYQYNKLISLFDNYSKALQYTEVSANSAGTAIDKFNKSYKESLEAKTNTLQSSFESMVLDSDMSKVYGSIIEATTALVKFIDKTGALKGTLSGLVAVMGIKAFVTFKTGIHEAYIELNKFKNAMDIVGKSRVSVKNFDKLLLLTNGLSKSQLKMVVSSKALTQAQRQQLLMASGLSQKEAELQLKTWQLARSTTGLTASTTSAKNALGGLWTIIKSNPIGMIGTAVSAGMMIWQKYKSSVEEHEQKMKEASEELNQTWQDEKSAIDDAISKYDEYNKKLQDNTLSISEVNDVKSQLKDIQGKLIETFGDEAEGIDLVNGKYDEQISKLATISKRKAEEYVAKQANNVESDKDYLNEKLTNYVSFGATHKPWGAGKADLNDGDIANSKIPELLKKYDKLNLIDGDTFGIQFNQGTREEIYNQLVDFYTDLSKIKDDPAVEKFKDGITETINSDDLFDQDKIDKAKESIKNYTEAEILKDDNTRKAYSDLTDAVDKYNQALEDGTGVEDAEKNLLTAKQTAEDSAEGISNAGDVFQDVYNQISSSAPIDVKEKFGLLTTDEEKAAEQNAQKLADTYQKTLNRFPTNESVTYQDVAESKSAVKEEYDKIHKWGLDSYADQIKDGTIQSKYGNVDMDNRQIIDWNLDNIEKWKDQLSDIKYYDNDGNFIDSYYDQLKESAEKGESNIDTVFGDMIDHIEGYDGISSLAFSHVVDNDDGTFEFLGQKTAEEYIYGILDEAKKDGDLSIDHILELDKQGDKNAEIYDAQGKKVGESYIHGIIAGFNSDSEDVSKLMHMSGKYGGVQIAQRDERKVESQYGNNEQNKIKNFLDENGISNNQELLDEFNQVTQNITNADEAILQWKIHQEQAAESFSTAWNDLKTLSESTDSSTDEEDKAVKALYKSLTDLADKGELAIDTFRDVDGAENYFDNLGISAGQAVNQINQLSDKNSQVSAMRKNIQSITDALGSKQTDGYATADDFAGFDATIKGLDSWKEFTTLLGDAKSSMEDCQTVANKLATEYVNSNEVICQLDDSTADYFRTQMTSMGVSNADAVVEQRLAYLHAQQAEGLQECTNASLEYNGQKITAANYSDFLANATANEIGALANEAIQSGNTANALSVLAVKKAMANGTTLSTSGDIQNLADLATAGSELGKLLNRLAQLKKGFTNGEPSDAVAKETEMLANKIKALIGGGSHVNVTTTPTSGTGTSNKGTSSGGSSTKKTPFDLLSDWAGQFFDWIEVRLDRLQSKIDSNISKAESKLNDKRYSAATSNYMSAVGNTYTKMYAEQKGRDKYLSTADSYLNKAVSLGAINKKLAKEIKTRVADGSINISRYSSDIQTVISTYKDWIDKAKDCTTAMQTLHDSLRTYAEDLKKVSDAQRDATVSIAETKQTIATGGVQNTATAKNSSLGYNNSVLNTKNNAYYTAAKSANSNVNKFAKSATSALNKGKIKKNTKYNATLNSIKGYIKKRVAIPDSLLTIVAKQNATLYNRLYMYNLSIENLETAREEYTTAFAANNAEKYNNIADKYKNLDDATNDAMDLNSTKSSNAVSAKDKNSYLDKQKSGYGTIVTRDKNEQNEYNKARATAKSNMSKSAKGASYSSLSTTNRNTVNKYINDARNSAKNSKIISASTLAKLSEYYKKGYISSGFFNACIDYNNALESYNQAKAQTEIDEQTQITQRAEIASQKFSNISTEYDNKRHQYDQTATELNNKMSILEAKGDGTSSVWYQRLYNNEQNNNSDLVSKRKALIDSLNDSVKKGDIKEYSTEWYDLRSQIDDVTNSIDESTKSLQEYKNQMEQIKWDRTDEEVQKMQNFIDENDFMINELSRRDLTSDDTGGLTKEGDAVAGLHIANYKAYQDEAQSYANDIEEINKKLADDPYNQRYIEQKEKLVKSYQDATKAAQDEKFATIDLMKSGYDALKNHISDLIDKYQDLIDSEKDAYDYASNISEKTKTLSDLRKQLTALSSDTSEESRTKIQELNVSLKDAEKDLKDTQYDKLISSTKDMLSDFQEDLDDSIQDIIKSLDDEFNKLIDNIDTKWGSSSETITDLMSKIDYTEQFDKLLGDKGVLNSTKGILDGIKTFCDDMWKNYDEHAKGAKTTDDDKGDDKGSGNGSGNNSDNGSNKGSSSGSSTDVKIDANKLISRIDNPTNKISPAYNNTTTNTNSTAPVGKVLSTSQKKWVNDFLKKNIVTAKQDVSKYGNLNKVLYRNWGKKILPVSKWTELAKKIGFSNYSSATNSAFYQTLHRSGIKGFKKGSDSIPYDMIANLAEDGTEIQYDVSKGVLKSVGATDIIFTNEEAKNLLKMARNPFAYSNMYTGTAFSMPPSVPVNNKVDNDVNVTFGDIHMDGVNDPNTFAKTLIDVYKNNTGNARKMINEDTLGRVDKRHNSLSVKRW